jgi:hypothetical protein
VQQLVHLQAARVAQQLLLLLKLQQQTLVQEQQRRQLLVSHSALEQHQQQVQLSMLQLLGRPLQLLAALRLVWLALPVELCHQQQQFLHQLQPLQHLMRALPLLPSFYQGPPHLPQLPLSLRLGRQLPLLLGAVLGLMAQHKQDKCSLGLVQVLQQPAATLGRCRLPSVSLLLARPVVALQHQGPLLPPALLRFLAFRLEQHLQQHQCLQLGAAAQQDWGLVQQQHLGVVLPPLL